MRWLGLIWLELVGNIIFELFYVLLSPLFWLVVALVWWQNKRMLKQKSKFFHLPQEKAWKNTALSVAFGLLGGLLGSVLMLVLGVDVAKIGVEYLWILALILALINPRFVCFAYAGGILVILQALFGIFTLNGVQILALIGVLHFVEGVLVFFSGHLQAMPIYLKWHDGRIVGAFNMQNFWPIPLIALYLTDGMSGIPLADIVMMPEFWPLISDKIHGGFSLYMLATVLAALGYSDLAVTHSPKVKARKSAKHLLIYGLAMIGLAILALKSQAILILAAVAAPIWHELIIYFGKKSEEKGEPIYVQSELGIMILDVCANSPAKKAGLRCGDIIIAANEEMVQEYRLLSGGNWRIKREEKLFKVYMPVGDWGIIPVPNKYRSRYLYFGGNFALPKLFWKKVKKLGQKIKKNCLK